MSQWAGRRAQRLAQRVHNNRTLAQLLSFVVVATVVVMVQLLSVPT